MDIIVLLFNFAIIIPSAILHEYMHGWVADRLGDPTARYAGRLTLNPLAHIDPFGTFLIPAALYLISGGNFLFAYAKPVPYNPYNLRDQRLGPLWVALAGPFTNFAIAAIFAAITRFGGFGDTMSMFLHLIVYMNIVLGVFNLVPIPPLDGSKILYAVLPASAERLRMTLDRFGFAFLLIFMLFFFPAIRPVIDIIYRLFTGASLL